MPTSPVPNIPIAAPLTQVTSSGWNEIKRVVDSHESLIVALETATETVPLHASETSGVINCVWQGSTSRYWESSAAPAEIVMPIRAEVGTSITAWSVDIRDIAAVVTARMFRATKNAALTAVDVAVVSIGNTSDQTLSQTLASPELVAANTFYMVKVDLVAIGMRFYGGSYTRTM